eukprot:m.63092 g.63092  ORF g.63092 m.63092 type:complete len:57 (+) comp13952_c0_seq1:402-572(+)
MSTVNFYRINITSCLLFLTLRLSLSLVVVYQQFHWDETTRGCSDSDADPSAILQGC